jgi:wyosine [tRNA(Phe)-imidazoG37] synthetase (radical SAM superfamily)
MYQHAEIVRWMQNRETHAIIPTQVDIDLTNICNQDCFYCNSADHRKVKPVQKKHSEYIKLLDKLASWRAHTPKSFGTLHTITYPGGGEPTLLPGYEKVLEHTLDLGFLTSITTNGSHLNDMIENMPVEKIRRMAWIGIDIDAGTEETYEKIRRSLTKNSLFNQVVENATTLAQLGANVDIKALINKYNMDKQSIVDLFAITKKIGARQLYLRPTILDGKAFDFQDQVPLIEELSKQYQVPVKYNFTKNLERNYKHCHQMYQFPVFCADGEIFTCCDNKGNSRFSLGRWDQGDFRDLWLSDRHHEIYNNVDTRFCPHCRPNQHNIKIQNILDDPSLLEGMYT